MATAALILYLIGLITAFGIRTLTTWRRTGDTGFRKPNTAPFTAPWWGTVLFTSALVLGLLAPVTGMLELAAVRPPTAIGIAGLATMLLGLILVLISQAAMGESWRIGVDETEHTALVTHGVFALIRNPIFTGMGVVLVGQLLAVPSLTAAAALAAFTAAVQIQVRAIEEPYLLRTHGEAYRSYVARTGRFLPLIGRWRPTDK